MTSESPSLCPPDLRALPPRLQQGLQPPPQVRHAETPGDSIRALWGLLTRVCRFHTVTEDARTRTRSTLAGLVRVRHATGTLVFTERGTNSATGHATHNTLLWTLRDATLSLAHLRHGPHTPTHLFSTDGRTPPSPHLCGDDTYAAHLHARGTRLILGWLVSGPAKSQTITTHYFGAGEPAATPTHFNR